MDYFRSLFFRYQRIFCVLPIYKVFSCHYLSYFKYLCLGLLKIVEPVGYSDFIKLLKKCRLIVTDSDGVQEEITSQISWCIMFSMQALRLWSSKNSRKLQWMDYLV